MLLGYKYPIYFFINLLTKMKNDENYEATTSVNPTSAKSGI